MNKTNKMGIIAAGVAVLAIGGGALLMNQQSDMNMDMGSSQSMNGKAMDMSSSRLSSLQGEAFDEAFIEEMSVHHTGAVAMAKLLEAETKNPELQKLAKAIIETQSKEIADMKSWAEEWGYDYKQPAQSAVDEMTANLIGKTGEDLDKAFLTDMLAHHQSAIDMAVLTANNASHAEIKTLGQAIQTTQRAEITLMKDIAKQAGYEIESAGAVEHGSGS